MPVPYMTCVIPKDLRHPTPEDMDEPLRDHVVIYVAPCGIAHEVCRLSRVPRDALPTIVVALSRSHLRQAVSSFSFVSSHAGFVFQPSEPSSQ